jgi:AAA+ ATPase superfamily predicted ATPase
MARNAPTPFIYGRPVRQDEFLNRHSELSTIFSRVYNCESTVISGEPHIGKSSLLLQLTDETVQRNYLGDEVGRFVFVPLDLLPVESDYTPATFWEEALEPLKERFGRATIARLAERAATAGYTRRSLERLTVWGDKSGGWFSF